MRAWLGLTGAEFYDEARVAILPMGFCFPGLDAKGGDLPPRAECAALWRARLFSHLPRLGLVVLAGLYAQRWHLGSLSKESLTATVADWRTILERQPSLPRYFPIPHPSWRNNAWIAAHPWFEAELLPRLRTEVRAAMASPSE